jgi:hypothetical protein
MTRSLTNKTATIVVRNKIHGYGKRPRTLALKGPAVDNPETIASDGENAIEPSYPTVSGKRPKQDEQIGPAPSRIVRTVTFAEVRANLRKQFQSNNIAALYGRRGVEMISKTAVTIGRATPQGKPDVDIGGYLMPGIARVHCRISLRSDMAFYLEVIGRDVVVNGNLFYNGQFVSLADSAIVDVVGIPLLFLENPDLRENGERAVDGRGANSFV